MAIKLFIYTKNGVQSHDSPHLPKYMRIFLHKNCFCVKFPIYGIEILVIMLEKLKEQEARLVKEQQSQLHEGKIKLSPKIDIEECLRNGYITADDYRKSHQ